MEEQLRIKRPRIDEEDGQETVGAAAARMWLGAQGFLDSDEDAPSTPLLRKVVEDVVPLGRGREPEQRPTAEDDEPRLDPTCAGLSFENLEPLRRVLSEGRAILQQEQRIAASPTDCGLFSNRFMIHCVEEMRLGKCLDHLPPRGSLSLPTLRSRFRGVGWDLETNASCRKEPPNCSAHSSANNRRYFELFTSVGHQCQLHFKKRNEKLLQEVPQAMRQIGFSVSKGGETTVVLEIMDLISQIPGLPHHVIRETKLGRFVGKLASGSKDPRVAERAKALKEELKQSVELEIAAEAEEGSEEEALPVITKPPSKLPKTPKSAGDAPTATVRAKPKAKPRKAGKVCPPGQPHHSNYAVAGAVLDRLARQRRLKMGGKNEEAEHSAKASTTTGEVHSRGAGMGAVAHEKNASSSQRERELEQQEINSFLTAAHRKRHQEAREQNAKPFGDFLAAYVLWNKELSAVGADDPVAMHAAVTKGAGSMIRLGVHTVRDGTGAAPGGLAPYPAPRRAVGRRPPPPPLCTAHLIINCFSSN